jgi:hypothetical protein
MSVNNTNRVSITEQANGVSGYTFSQQADHVTVRNIPAGGIDIFLPPSPSSGDTYTFAADGTVSEANPITVAPTQTPAGQTVAGAASQSWVGPYASATFRFDEGSGNWAVTAAFGAREAAPTTAVQLLGPSAIQGPAASVSFSSAAFEALTGVVKITAVFSVQASATGTGVTFTLHRDLTSNPALGPSPVVGSSTDTNHQVTQTFVWLDTVTAGASHEWIIEATASTGTVTAQVNSSSILLENVSG